MSTTVPTTGVDYPADYVELPFTTDEQTLADDAVAALQAFWGPDWIPNDGDQEVVLIETLAPMATAAAQQASSIPPAAFIALCTKLYGIPYGNGTPAQTTVTLGFQDAAANYYVPAGSEFDLGDYAFTTVSDVYSGGALTVAGVAVVAGDVGSDYNDLTDENWSNVTLPVWVTSLSTDAPTGDGSDAQDDYDYLNTASRELQLRGRMIVTLPDFEIVAVDTPGVGRAYAVTNSSRDVTVTLTDPQGQPVPQTVKDTLAAIYQTATLVNVTFTLADATYTAVSVAYAVMKLPGFDSQMLEQSINDALSSQLSPPVWGTIPIGQPGAGPGTNTPDDTVRLNKIISIIGATPGVDYVVANSVQINGAAADLAMPGALPLPTPGTMTGIIDTPVSS